MSGLADWLTSWLYFYIQVGQVAAAAAAVAETELNKKKEKTTEQVLLHFLPIKTNFHCSRLTFLHHPCRV